jgi:hypothetical protein
MPTCFLRSRTGATVDDEAQMAKPLDDDRNFLFLLLVVGLPLLIAAAIILDAILPRAGH